jgi:acyl-CoA thioesterase
MESISHIRWLAADPASRLLGMRLLHVVPGSATEAMRVTDDMLNGHAITHSGFVFALAGTAFAVACNGYGRATVAAAAITSCH